MRQVGEDGSCVPGVVPIHNGRHWPCAIHLTLDGLKADLESASVRTGDGAEGVEEAVQVVGASMRPDDLHHHAALTLALGLPAGATGDSVAIDRRVGQANSPGVQVFACGRRRLETTLRCAGVLAGATLESRGIVGPKAHGRRHHLAHRVFVKTSPGLQHQRPRRGAAALGAGSQARAQECQGQPNKEAGCHG